MSDVGIVFVIIFITLGAVCVFFFYETKAEKERLSRVKKEKEEEEAREAREQEKQKRIADQKIAQLKRYEKALSFSTYELAEIVINIVDCNNYDKLKEVVSILSDQMHVNEVLVEASKKLMDRYENSIKDIANDRCVDINYQEELIERKLASLIGSCVEIGRSAIGKKIGIVVSAVDSSVAKGAIRKTKKWEK